MKTADLTGNWLDYWVAKAEGHEVDPPLAEGQPWPDREKLGRKYEPNYIRFSMDWKWAGPIIDRDAIRLSQEHAGGDWIACIGWGNDKVVWSGPTPLIAAMRAKVASRFGPEVPDPA